MNKLAKTAACLATCLGSAGIVRAEVATYMIDPSHTFVTFEASHFGTSTLRGRFDRKQGTVEFDRAGKAGRVDLSIETTSVSTGVAPLDKHLQSKDFFNTAEYPSARFVAEGFTFNGDKVSRIAGMLTMLGQTQPVTLNASRFNCYTNPVFRREVCGGDFEAVIQRSQWGMTFGLPGIPDSVHLLVQVEAIKQ